MTLSQGLAPIRFLSFGTWRYDCSESLGPRDTYGFEIVWIRDGGARWTYQDQSFNAGANSILLSQPGHRETFNWSSQRRTIHDFVHFELSEAAFADFGGVASVARWPCHRVADEHPLFGELLQFLMRLLNDGLERNHELASETLRYFLRLFSIPQGPVHRIAVLFGSAGRTFQSPDQRAG